MLQLKDVIGIVERFLDDLESHGRTRGSMGQCYHWRFVKLWGLNVSERVCAGFKGEPPALCRPTVALYGSLLTGAKSSRR